MKGRIVSTSTNLKIPEHLSEILKTAKVIIGTPDKVFLIFVTFEAPSSRWLLIGEHIIVGISFLGPNILT